MQDFDDFIKYLFVTDQLDEVFWGKKNEEKEEDVLKRTLKKTEEDSINNPSKYKQNN